MPPPPQERWSILARIPKVIKDKEAKRTFPRGADVTLACADPPRASLLTVPFRVSPPPCIFNHPYVAAADPSGLLLLSVTEPAGDVTYHLCHARTGEATCLRPQNCLMVGCHGANVGLMVLSGGGGVVVAELQPSTDGSGRATLLCYTVGGYDEWPVKELAYSPPLLRQWYCEEVVSYGGMLWWVELSYGILACHPCSDTPELLHVPLPTVTDPLPPGKSATSLASRGARSCVKVSGGKLRYVQIHGGPGAPVVSTWALTEARQWNPERRVPLPEIWADDSYLDAMLPGTVPALALLHPADPDKLYFFLGSCIFAVDLRRGKVVEFGEFDMPEPPNWLIVRSSHLVHAWQYDPSSSRSDSVLTCLRQEKKAAARSSWAAVMPVMPVRGKTDESRKRYRSWKRYRYNCIMRQQHEEEEITMKKQLYKEAIDTAKRKKSRP